MRGIFRSVRPRKLLRHSSLIFIFLLVSSILISVPFIPIQLVYADPATVSVEPSSVVDTGLTPESPGEPYELTLKATGDGSYVNWTGNRGLKPTADGTFTDWTGGYGDWDDWPTHNGDTDYVNATADAQNETSQLENPTADDTWDIGKVRVVAYARANETTDENLVLSLGIPAAGSYDSSPTAHNASAGVSDPTYAYDGSLYTWAEFKSGSWDYLDVRSFSTSGAPTGNAILSVDFKMRWSESGGGPNKQYRILYKVSPSTTETVLVDWTGADKVLSTDVWANQPEPNDESWSWTDIPHIKFVIETQDLGGGGKGTIDEYEAWVTVNYGGAVSLYEGESHALTTTYERYTSEWPWNPSSNASWSWGDIGALEAGATSRQVGAEWTGEIRVTQLYLEVVGGTPLRPDGDSGTFTDWVGDYGDWNETSPHNGDTNYVKADSGVGGYAGESSTLQDHGSETWNIETVRVVMYARAEGTTNDKVYLMLYDTGWMWEYYSDVGYTPTSTYQKYTWEWTVSPETFFKWTWSDIDSLEAGVYSEAVGPWTGEIRVTQLYVEVIGGTGTYKAWDESPTHNSESDYLSAEARTLAQTSALEDHVSETWAIARVRVTLVARITEVDAEPEKVAPSLVTGGSKYDGVFTALTTDYTSYTNEWGLNPVTGDLWTWSEIDALEAGATTEVGGSTWTGEIRVTQIYVEVSGPGFKVNIQANGVTEGLWQYGFEIFYNPDHIRGVWGEPDCPHRVGPFLGSAEGTPTENAGEGFNHTVGWLKFTGGYLAETGQAKYCPNGTGVIAIIVFECLRQGETDLRLGEQTVLFDYAGSKFVEGRAYVSDGYFRNIDSSSIPTADFSWTADSPVPNPNEPLEGYNVTFTDTSTAPGGKTIDTRRWYFWRRGKVLRELRIPVITSESSVTRNFTTRATYNVTLTVFDSDGVVGSTSDWLTVKAHDVYFNAIYTNSSRCLLPAYPEGKIQIDRILEIKAEAINEGDFTETFDVTLFWTAFYEGESHNGTIGTKQTVTGLAAGAKLNVTFLWDTTGFSLTHPDRYALHANASRVTYEYDTERTPTSLADNEYVQGAPRFRLHDMAVTENPPAYPPPLVPSEQTIQPGDPVQVTVTVTNEGDFNETSLTIKTWAEKQGAAPIPINTTTYSLMTNMTFSETYMAHIPPYEDNYTATYSFTWDTSTFAGNYTIWSNVTRTKYSSDLASDASSGQKNVVVVDASGFGKGDSIEIRDDNNWEMNTIHSIAGNTLAMNLTLKHTYTVAANGLVKVPDDYEPNDNTYTAGWVKVQPAVPEFPLGVALEIAVAVVIVYVWWKGRHKAKHQPPLISN